MKKTATVFLAGIILFLSGCGQKTETSMEAPVSTVTAAEKTAAVDPASAGILKGRVLFEGAAPEAKKLSVKGNPECAVFHANGEISSEEVLVKDGMLKNAFVYIKEGLEKYTFPAPTEAVTVENTGCHYIPHVSGAQVNQPVNFLNNDPTLHNFHAYPKNSKPFNLGLPFQGMKQVRKFDASEVMVPLKCDVHPWMQGYIGVLSHPYFAVTGDDGSFELKNLPPGEYLVEAWHEKLGIQSQKITIEPRATKEIEFKYS